MKILIAAGLLACSGCATVTLNGQDLARMGASAAIVGIAVALIVGAEDEPEADKHSRCPGCPPFTPVD